VGTFVVTSLIIQGRKLVDDAEAAPSLGDHRFAKANRICRRPACCNLIASWSCRFMLTEFVEPIIGSRWRIYKSWSPSSGRNGSPALRSLSGAPMISVGHPPNQWTLPEHRPVFPIFWSDGCAVAFFANFLQTIICGLCRRART
jgi:hypothetical protein